MASVTLRFTEPTNDDVAALRIYEAAVAGGPFTLIERVADVGVYPTYITHYTSHAATNDEDWFAIAWEDIVGNVGDMSLPVQGGVETVIDEIVRRAQQRDLSLDMGILRQEAEAVVEMYFGKDPYTVTEADITSGRVYRTLNGLTYLLMARGIIAKQLLAQGVASATIGLVSFRHETTTQSKINVQDFIDLANKELGIATSLVLQLEEVAQRVLTPTWQAQYDSIPWVIVGHAG